MTFDSFKDWIFCCCCCLSIECCSTAFKWLQEVRGEKLKHEGKSQRNMKWKKVEQEIRTLTRDCIELNPKTTQEEVE